MARQSALRRGKECAGKTAEVAFLAAEHGFSSATPHRRSARSRSGDFHHGLLGGLALLAGWAGGVRGERVMARSFESELELATRSFELTKNEDGHSEELDVGDFMRGQSDELEVEDTYEEGVPGKFTRLYRTVTNSVRLNRRGEPREERLSAGIEGARVTFERNQQGSFDRSTDAEGARKVMLKDLRVNLDLRRLLPPASLAPGETWALSFAQLGWLLSPAVDLARRPPRARVEGPEGRLSLTPSLSTDPLWKLFSGAEGEATATLEPADEGEESSRKATLQFRFENTRVGGMADLIGSEAEVEDELCLCWEGDGTLAWDEADGSVSIELAGELEFDEEFTVTSDRAGKAYSINGALAGSGELKLAASERLLE